MEFVADAVLGLGSLILAFYCSLLSQRLKKLTNIEGGLGSAIDDIVVEVTSLEKTLQQLKAIALNSEVSINDANIRADASIKRLELLIASLHDLPRTEIEESQTHSDARPTKNSSPEFFRSTRDSRHRRTA